MKPSSIPFDPTNPGQVFACLGFLELSEAFNGPTLATFRNTNASVSTFELESEKDSDPFASALAFLAQAEVKMLAPQGSTLSYENKNDSIEVEYAPPHQFPCPEPAKPEPLPVMLQTKERAFIINSWSNATVSDNTKFWTGSRGMPGAVLVRNALNLVRDEITHHRANPFSLAAPQSSGLRFDWRRDNVPLRAGFSMNNHANAHLLPVGYPLVEVLAAIGLTHARPCRVDPKSKLAYRYGIIFDQPLPAVFHRAALGLADIPFPTQTFTMQLGWAGQPGKARCISRITKEETHESN